MNRVRKTCNVWVGRHAAVWRACQRGVAGASFFGTYFFSVKAPVAVWRVCTNEKSLCLRD